jgi:predicted RNA binding protein YcfA (HicA-like mRNA interferase family)
MPISGKQTIKILQKHGFVVSRQKGSHVVLVAQTASGKKIAVVPNHHEMKKGTLRSIARQSGIDPTELGL